MGHVGEAKVGRWPRWSAVSGDGEARPRRTRRGESAGERERERERERGVEVPEASREVEALSSRGDAGEVIRRGLAPVAMRSLEQGRRPGRGSWAG